jgi:hypothetical protein
VDQEHEKQAAGGDEDQRLEPFGISFVKEPNAETCKKERGNQKSTDDENEQQEWE